MPATAATYVALTEQRPGDDPTGAPAVATLRDVGPREPTAAGETFNAMVHGDAQRQVRATRERYLAKSLETELPDGQVCLDLARCDYELGNLDDAFAWVARAIDADDSFITWMSAARLLADLKRSARPSCRRRLKVAITGSWTTGQFAAMLGVAALRAGIDLDLHEADFGQYRQDIIDPGSSLYRVQPDVLLIAVHEGAAELPAGSDAPGDAVEAECERWAGLWELAGRRCGAPIVQHGFAVRPDPALGHLATRVTGSRHAMLEMLNLRLAAEAPASVHIVDCDRVAADFGKRRWFDDRYWHIAKQAVALDALPLLARHTAAVMSAAVGLSRKCLAFDLDNTIWGGVIGEDGIAGIELGASPRGEAYVALQDYIVQLKERGVVLAVVSKNDEADAKRAFESHPDMRLRLADIASFIANWGDKPANLRRLAAELGLALDAIVFLDDNPAERESVRQALPEVEVLVVPDEPVGILQALSRSLLFEPASLTEEDRSRAALYRARGETARLRSATGSVEDFYRSLDMKAAVAPFDDLHLPRIVQLIGKTNQFNLTVRRHGAPAVRAFMEDPDHVTLYLKLRDRFADHGLVAAAIGEKQGGTLDIDTFLMSCRVIGRTVERELFRQLATRALELGCERIRGTYMPSVRNGVVRELYAALGFEPIGMDADGSTIWEYDVTRRGVPASEFISGWSGAP
jgi:FkbH-like protein